MPTQVVSPAAAAMTAQPTAAIPASVAAHRARATGRENSRVSRPAVSSEAAAAIRLAQKAPSGIASSENSEAA